MTTKNTTTQPSKPLIKATGWLYITIILTSILSLIFLGGAYTVMGDSVASVAKMSQHVTLVRINAAYEVLMFSSVIILAVLLFEITKTINKPLARRALLFRLCEAILGYIGVILTLGILAVAGERAAPGDGQALAVALYDLKDIVYKVLMVCISLGTIIFFSLLHKEKYIPRFLSIWGLGGFGLMLLASILQIVALPGGMVVNAVAAALAISFEIVVGIWLIVKGLSEEETLQRRQASQSLKH